jgi:transposase
MPQLRLPLFPTGATEISQGLSFSRTEETITYFHYDLPFFSHSQDERASFRLVSAILHVTCGAKQADIARAFGVPKINIKRAVKVYRDCGTAGFFAQRATRGAAVLTEPVMAQAQNHLDAGLSPREVAAKMAIKADTLIKAVRAGRLREPLKKHQNRRAHAG